MHRTPPAKHTRRRHGFSLLEVVIAMGILAFGMLTLALLQVHALKHGAAGRHTGDAAAVARSNIEQVHRVPWAVLTAAVGAGWQAPTWAGASGTWNNVVASPHGGNATEKTYNVAWRVSPVAGSTCLRDVEVRVSWAEENVAGNKQTILATRRYNWGGATC